MNILKSILRSIGKVISVIFTGGKYGSSVRSDHSDEYAKRQEQRRKDFAAYGGRDCKICGIRIPANKYYCPPCYFKYVKK